MSFCTDPPLTAGSTSLSSPLEKSSNLSADQLSARSPVVLSSGPSASLSLQWRFLPLVKRGPGALRIRLVGDNHSAVGFEPESCFAARVPEVPGAPGHREYHVLGFEATDALRVDLGPSSLLGKMALAMKAASAPRWARGRSSSCTGRRCGSARCPRPHRIWDQRTRTRRRRRVPPRQGRAAPLRPSARRP